MPVRNLLVAALRLPKSSHCLMWTSVSGLFYQGNRWRLWDHTLRGRQRMKMGNLDDNEDHAYIMTSLDNWEEKYLCLIFHLQLVSLDFVTGASSGREGKILAVGSFVLFCWWTVLSLVRWTFTRKGDRNVSGVTGMVTIHQENNVFNTHHCY